jgi:DNA invertase Pin-like site-specific DNA recombinase
MLQPIFDPQKRYRVVLYLRTSGKSQDPINPEQKQRATIEATIRRLNLPWEIVNVYTDRAISGRFFKKRRQFQKMLCDIRTRKLLVDLILVDTFERFGRNEDLANLRQELHRHYGCLVLTADTGFADPASVTSLALAAFKKS